MQKILVSFLVKHLIMNTITVLAILLSLVDKQWTNLHSGVIELLGGSSLSLNNNPLPLAFPHSVLADTAITKGYEYGQWVIHYAQCLVVADPNNGFPYTGNSKTHYSVRLKNIDKESGPASKGVSIYFISLGY